MSGSGSVIQKDKSVPRSRCRSWILRVHLGVDPATGKYRQKSKAFHGTYRQAQDALREWVVDKPAPKRITLEDYAQKWIEGQQVAEGTKEKLRHHIECFTMHLGKKQMYAITADDVALALKRLEAGESPSGKKLSGTYLAGVHSTAKRLFDNAVRDNVAAYNVISDVPPPKLSTERKTALTEEQVAYLLDTLDSGNPPELAALLSLTTGMRRGEISELRWDDIDVRRMTIHVRGTKSKASDAIIPISAITASILPERAGDRLVPMEPHSITRWWERNKDRLGCPGTTFHVLRHTYASMLAASGAHPATMQRLMRHADSRTTMDIYTHVNMEQERAALEAMENHIRR